ncbi:hypothetical protein P5X09_24270, partial [Enterobacter hormaechei]|uniref:hypothetical protein n=1 Tax=Enterobacter hormaechei TaxID=158836 RepID=UPI0023F94157
LYENQICVVVIADRTSQLRGEAANQVIITHSLNKCLNETPDKPRPEQNRRNLAYPLLPRKITQIPE